MSKKLLNTTRIIANEKITKQIQKGQKLAEDGLAIIKEKLKNGISSRERDNFESAFKQWVDITIEVLLEVFKSYTYSQEFNEIQSSKVEYVSSGWIPDIKYYIRKQIVPKLDYLRLLISNIEDFDEVDQRKMPIEEINSNDQVNNDKVKMDKLDTNQVSNIDINKITISKIISDLSLSQIIKIVGSFIAILAAIFWLGYYVNSWKIDKQKYDLSIENENLVKEIKMYKSKLDSLEKRNKLK